MPHGPTAAAKTGDSLERALLGAVGPVCGMLVALCGTVLVIRRIGGGFAPPGGAGAAAVALLGGLLVLVVDAASRPPGLPTAWRVAARAGYAAAYVAMGLPPVLGSPADVLLFLVAAGVAGGILAEPVVRGRAGPWLAGLRRATRPASRDLPTATALPALATLLPTAAPVHVLQRFERCEVDGIDCLRGTLTLTVPQGARAAHGHVGFCPSFRLMPQVDVTTSYDGVEALVTAAEVVPWGARIECRLDEPAEEPVAIPVDVVARSPS